ncbi:4-oxalocrotonate tautomerase family protein [Aquimarina sp. RZ0]|uniref:tautomerase family protein n=1 Tax=Aquimarina sp. RZ0 TaxID=2607730 RepID=UPI0011F178CD|nr:4-oxalocrotonate tautomerase family protein [Aquimarina sp. RZ0]KAA1245278.1 4-oxalocrotonate tautomerase family protein [Aquimarina sp. RZ0]
MPFVNVRTFKGALSNQERKELQTKITDLLIEYEGKGNPEFKKFVWVMLEEEEPKNWMIGGTTISDVLDNNLTYKQNYLANLSEK